MKIEIEELNGKVIAINDGVRSASVVEATSALDFHLARDAIKKFTEMLNRHLLRGGHDG